MKLFIVAVITMVLTAFVGCAAMQQNPSTARLAVQYSTMKYINGDAAKAKRIATHVDRALAIVHDGQVAIADLDKAIRDRIDWTTIPIEDKVLLDTLLLELRAQLEQQVGRGMLTADQLVQVATALQWIKEATVMAGGSP